MISMDELLHGADFDSQPDEVKKNLPILLERVNKVRAQWNAPWTVTSGLRTIADQLRIYRDKAARHLAPFLNGIFDQAKVPMGSQHLKGAAVDIYDPGLKITAWLKANPKILEEAELWCEEGNSDWVHFQIVPPKSGNRWFLP